MVRVTRKEASARLNVSKTTLDRMIKRGELATETEQHGLRHTVWVLMDDVVEDTNEDSTGNTNGHLPASSEYTGGDTGAENLALQTEVMGSTSGGPVPRKADRRRLAPPGAAGATQDHDESPARGARRSSPTEPLVVALPVTPGHHNQDTAQVAASIGCSPDALLRWIRAWRES